MTASIHVTVNGEDRELDVEPRELLLDVLRSRLRFTSVHAACEQGACGACTVFLDGATVQSCLVFAVQADGGSVMTVEGVTTDSGLHPLQRAFTEHHALQCGYCTPALVLSAMELLERNPSPSRDEIEHALSGNLCRCTGYTPIVDAVADVSTRLQEGSA